MGVTIAGWLAIPGGAQAAPSYTMRLCGGESVERLRYFAADDLAPTVDPGIVATDECPTAGVSAQPVSGPRLETGTKVVWSIAAPPGTQIRRLELWHHVALRAAGWKAEVLAIRDTEQAIGPVADAAGESLGGGEQRDLGARRAVFRFDAQPANAVALRVRCAQAAGCSPMIGDQPAFTANAYRFELELEDPSAPEVLEAVPATPTAPVSSLRLQATDLGGGIREVQATVAGRTAGVLAVPCAEWQAVPCRSTIEDLDLTLDPEVVPEGRTTVSLRAIDAAGNVSATRQIEVERDAHAPISTRAPEISSRGPAAVDVPLRVDVGDWDAAGYRFATHWERCGGACVRVASGESYVVSEADAGADVRAVVTATDAAGRSASAPTPRLAVAPLPPPQELAPPQLEDAPEVGKVATLRRGDWRYANDFDYSWQACTADDRCTDIPEHIDNQLLVSERELDLRLRAVVRVSGPGGVVVKPTASLPVRTGSLRPLSAPTIGGTERLGGTLRAEPGAWSVPSARLSFEYQWERCRKTGCRKVGNQTTSPFWKLRAADVGATLRVVVSARQSASSTEEARSEASGRITRGRTRALRTPSVDVAGVNQLRYQTPLPGFRLTIAYAALGPIVVRNIEPGSRVELRCDACSPLIDRTRQIARRGRVSFPVRPPRQLNFQGDVEVRVTKAGRIGRVRRGRLNEVTNSFRWQPATCLEDGQETTCPS